SRRNVISGCGNHEVLATRGTQAVVTVREVAITQGRAGDMQDGGEARVARHRDDLVRREEAQERRARPARTLRSRIESGAVAFVEEIDWQQERHRDGGSGGQRSE